MGLDKFKQKLKEVGKKHNQVIAPARKSIRLETQYQIPGVALTGSRRKVFQGTFYEHVTAAFYGGELRDQKIEVDSETYKGSIKPDVVDTEGRLIWESKAFAIYWSCNIMHRQILGNMFFQLENPEYQIRYALYRHPLEGMNKTYTGDLEQLTEDLSGKTLFSATLPLDVILHLSIPGNDNGSKAVRHYGGHKKYPNCICLNQPFTRGLILDPEGTLESIGLDASEYSIELKKSPQIKINENKLKPFPITVISHRDHGRWVEGFSRDKERQEQLKEQLTPPQKTPETIETKVRAVSEQVLMFK